MNNAFRPTNTRFLATLFALAILALSLLLSGCGAAGQGKVVNVAGGSYRAIGPPELRTMLQNKDFLFVNVHIPYQGEIAGTDLFLPYNEVQQRLSQLPQDRSAKIVLYCRSGHMSGLAAAELVKLGFSDVWHLEGGMVEWERQGNQLLQIPRP